MTLLDYAFIASAVLCLVAALTGGTIRRPAALVTTALFLSTAAAELCVGGLRWQFLGVLLSGVLGAGLAGFRTTTGRPRSRFGGACFGLGLTAALGAVIVGGMAIWGFHPLNLPEPGGTHPVGTTVTSWTDRDRAEQATADLDDRREITAQIWYPAAAPGPRARYLGSTEHESQLVADGMGRSFDVPPFLFGEAVEGHSWATENASLPTGNQRYPVVLFSPGLNGVRTQNTAWAEFLAARGYLVVALDHPYDSQAHTQADTDRVTAIRAADLSFALDQFETMPFFRGRLARERIAVAGHSVGGAAALQAAAQDHRFRAAIDIDGMPRNGARPTQPVLALTAGDGTGNPQNDAEYDAALDEVIKNNGRRVTVPHTKHLSFTDAPFLLPDLPFLFGTTSPHNAYKTLTDETLAFLNSNVEPPG
jgi:dienelactone hydrolase